MKNVFAQTRQTTPNTIADLMADFRSKQALGKYQASRTFCLKRLCGYFDLRINVELAYEKSLSVLFYA